MAEQYNSGYSEVQNNNQDFQSFLKDKAFEVWEKRNEQNILILVICLLFLIAWAFDWVCGGIFCITSACLAIYELFPERFKHNKKQTQKAILIIYLCGSLAAFVISIIFENKRFIHQVYSIATGELIGLAISFIVIKRLKKLAKIKGLLIESNGIVDLNQTTDDNINDDLMEIEASFLALDENIKKYCCYAFIGVLVLLWIIGMFAQLAFLSFILYSILIMILYEGTENIPFLAQLIQNKKLMLLAGFSLLGAIFFILSLVTKAYENGENFSGDIYSGISGMLFACSLSIFYFKKWKKLFKLPDNQSSQLPPNIQNPLNPQNELALREQSLPISFKEQVNASQELKSISSEQKTASPVKESTEVIKENNLI
eukprot:TRINITY_DN10401_c0_g1_i2.p1 TRINITY_DN10401_c0_g1~~TRINITY_DN10401_c0_g1_i2.p1  ORF type:complete len:371 (-),score=44.59 TRINITY_DN10401_c0_g1_i2:175-1287(-)